MFHSPEMPEQSLFMGFGVDNFEIIIAVVHNGLMVGSICKLCSIIFFWRSAASYTPQIL